MPDNFITNSDGSNNSTNQSSTNTNQQTTTNSTSQRFNDPEIAAYLKSIDATLKSILNDGQTMSQANARSQMSGRDDFRRSYSQYMGNVSQRSRSQANVRRAPSSFADGLEEALMESILGSDFKAKMQRNVSAFADMMGVSIRDVPGMLGKELGKQILDRFKSTNPGQQVFSKIDSFKTQAASRVSDAFGRGLQKDDERHGRTGDRSYYNRYTQFMSQPASAPPTSSPGSSAMNAVSAASTSEAGIELDSRFDTALQYLQSIDDNLYLYVHRHEVEGKELPSEALGPESPEIAEYRRRLDQVAENRNSNLADAAQQALSNLSNVTDASSAATAEAGVEAAGAAESTATAAGLADMAAASEGAGAVMSGLVSAGSELLLACPELLIVIVGITAALEILGPAIQGVGKLIESAGHAFNRSIESRKKRMELEQKRLKDDIEAMVAEPFNILKDAAQSLYDAWDSNLRVINGTQGYNKSDLQDLMSSYAQRLRDEDLTKVVSGADITSNLAKVLESGLSGAVAEEFAYMATKLNAAVPTQDFFSYSDTYASLAANAIRQGKSEAEAIEYANSQLEIFASDVLYASRTLSGGFSTGLKDAESLFSSATKIAQASKIGNPSEIAGVLTAVSAATGAIAPDLASEMTDLIIKATTGGNSSEITALRSLAGINASNTEFLQQVAENPQSIFTAIFRNLASMQSMSPNAYMEVAEGLSSTFGMSMDSFARIDFNYLADAISSMTVNSASLDENIKHLVSGETTLTSDQLKYQQINQYMLDEGLALVLDNEVARTIQQHMWDEQLAQQIQEATYAVDLQGSALEFLEGIRSTVDNIVGLLNPLSWIKKTIDLMDTGLEILAQDADIKALLNAGKVGNGNATSMYQLTTRGVELGITDDILTLMGGTSRFADIENSRKTNLISALVDPYHYAIDNNSFGSRPDVATTNGASTNFSGRTKYAWGTVGKSIADAMINTYSTGSNISSLLTNTAATNASENSSKSSANSAIVSKLNKMLEDEYLKENFIDQNKGYDEWRKSAVKFGIADIDKAIEAAGYSETAIQQKFDQMQTERGNELEIERRLKEEEFWKILEDNSQTLIDNTQSLIELTETSNDWLSKIYTVADTFYDAWNNYVVQHTVYDASYNYSDVQRIKNQENNQGKDDAINALAEALVKNSVDLRDPAVQTNALLSKILLILSAIEQQNNKQVDGLSLADSLAAAALGL